MGHPAALSRKGTRLRVPRAGPPFRFLALSWRAERRREGVEFGGRHQVGADWVLVDIFASGFEVGAVEYEMVGESSLPDGEA